MTHKADAANAAVRAFLGLVSRKAGPSINKAYRKEAIDFFYGRDALTGELLEDVVELDHLIPANRKHLGLSVPGNLVPVRPSTNQKKAGMTFEAFFERYPEHAERREKLEEWMELHGFTPQTLEHLRPSAEHLYNLVQNMVTAFADAVSQPPPLSESSASSGTAMTPVKIGSEKRPVLNTKPDDQDIFMQRLNAIGHARITAYDAQGMICRDWPKDWKTKGLESMTRVRNYLWSRPDLRGEAREREGICAVEIEVLSE